MIESQADSLVVENQKLGMQAELSCLATVTVTFNPDILEMESQLRSLPESSIKIIVDNASQYECWIELQVLSNQFKNIYLLRSENNLGLAAAINRGAEHLRTLNSSAKFILLLDQDSVPQSGSIATLLAAFQSLQEDGRPVGCVGPSLVDLNTGLTHGFHQSTKFRWKRAYPVSGSLRPVHCANINGSGTLMSLELFHKLGGLDEQLFIDHVDTEWSFRVVAHGYELWGIPTAVFDHSMGEASISFWLFGWRVWPIRSPRRHYFLFRNATILMKRPYIPLVWKTWAIVKLALTVSVVVITGPSQVQQIKNMWQGIKTGLCKNGN